MSMSRKWLPWMCVGLAAVAAACSQAAEPAATVTVTASDESTASATATVSAQEPSTAPTAEPETFQGVLVPVQETRGTTTVNVQLPQLTGGAAAVRDRFNSGMRTALDDLATPDSEVTVQDGALIGEDGSQVTTITPHIVAGVAIFNWNTQGAAHPNNSVATITIAVDTAQPILLSDVFVDQLGAAERLSTAVMQIDGRAEPLDPPSIDSFLNWVPTADGFRTYVSVIHAMGDYLPVTVPWEQISDLMTPEMQAMLIQ